jgi:hypothetical protein
VYLSPPEDSAQEGNGQASQIAVRHDRIIVLALPKETPSVPQSLYAVRHRARAAPLQHSFRGEGRYAARHYRSVR